MFWGRELRQIDHIRQIVEVLDCQRCSANRIDGEPIASSHATDHHIGSRIDDKVDVVLRSIVQRDGNICLIDVYYTLIRCIRWTDSTRSGGRHERRDVP